MNSPVENSPEKLDKQVGFKVMSQTFEQLLAAARAETRKRNELARLIFEWAFERYKEAGSYDALIGRVKGPVLPYHSVPKEDEAVSGGQLFNQLQKAHVHVSSTEPQQSEQSVHLKKERKGKNKPTGT